MKNIYKNFALILKGIFFRWLIDKKGMNHNSVIVRSFFVTLLFGITIPFITFLILLKTESFKDNNSDLFISYKEKIYNLNKTMNKQEMLVRKETDSLDKGKRSLANSDLDDLSLIHI